MCIRDRNHADGVPDSGTYPSADGELAGGHRIHTRTDRTARIAQSHHLQRPYANSLYESANGQSGRRQPAAHQFPAVSVRRLHHLAVRHLPVAYLTEIFQNG